MVGSLHCCWLSLPLNVPHAHTHIYYAVQAADMCILCFSGFYFLLSRLLLYVFVAVIALLQLVCCYDQRSCGMSLTPRSNKRFKRSAEAHTYAHTCVPHDCCCTLVGAQKKMQRKFMKKVNASHRRSQRSFEFYDFWRLAWLPFASVAVNVNGIYYRCGCVCVCAQIEEGRGAESRTYANHFLVVLLY